MAIVKKIKKALFGGLIAILTATSCKAHPLEPKTQLPITIEYKAYYTPYECDSAKLIGSFTNWQLKPMTKTATNKFIYVDTVNAGNHLFNIESFFNPPNPNYTSEWIVGGRWYPGPDSLILHGIRAAYVKLNGTALNNSYLVIDNLGHSLFSVSVSQSGISPGPGEHAPIYEEVPPETQCKTWYVEYAKPQEYNPNWNNIIAWMQAIALSGQSEVRVNYLRVGARLTNNQDVVLARHEYSGGDYTPPSEYVRYPWYANDEHEQASFNISNGYMIFQPSDDPNRVYHWWTPRAEVPTNTKHCWLEFEVQVNGQAGIQAGIDFRPNQSQLWPIKEAGATRWYIGPGTYTVRFDLNKDYGVEEEKNKKPLGLKIWPNPYIDYVRVNAREKVKVYSLTGNYLNERTVKEGKVMLDDLVKGIYFIEGQKVIKLK